MENTICPSTKDLLSIESMKSFVLPHYDLQFANVTMVKFKDTDKQRAVYRVDFKNKSYCLKKVYYDESNLLYVYSAMEWLYRNNLNVPKLLPTKSNNRYIKYMGMLFILTPWVNGLKCDFDNKYHMELSSKDLAKLHKSSQNFVPISGSCTRIGCDDYHISVDKHLEQILISAKQAKHHNDRFSKIFLKNLNINLELAKLSSKISSSINCSELSKSLCHGDFVNKNILIADSNVWIIDFDKCKMDYSAHDISYFLRRLLKRENTNWDTDLALKIIDDYMKVNPLTPSDLKYILAYIAFPQKYWKISRDYYKNIKRCNKNAFISLLERGLDRTDSQLKFIKEMMILLEKDYEVNFN
ncbi:CotS family spore coat protein [Clostridium gasigenes]|uniref:CotS family spore coat protein n=1 Tax=Clostridium gasigenes TaxID=94869 RepID=A0A7X0SE59_9CLOT|nr:CotS family spore coat protein [Clostridium gasigenes]MBB6714698.1 CotS family spore coat protein [Clostridium gasigenes]MBU3105229.1 CotS family spore coat protein [Clostridium gasigenes]MBU3135896.1 CotS family spore coat protein [Clostridium gasigenes]NKF07024.1 CotS family spore coat protein [Clostridium gasigenes]QSW19721.1 CotS family spore coat protein [Clostridium gasigenes]